MLTRRWIRVNVVPLGQEFSIIAEFLYPIITSVRYIHVACIVHCYAKWAIELTSTFARRAPLIKQNTIGAELLHLILGWDYRIQVP